MRVAPTGWQLLIDYIPINATLAVTTGLLFRGFAFTAMIGLFSRISALLTAILGVYVLGVPQFFGKDKWLLSDSMKILYQLSQKSELRILSNDSYCTS